MNYTTFMTHNYIILVNIEMTHIAESDVFLVSATEGATMRSLQQLPLVAKAPGIWPCVREEVGGVCWKGDDTLPSDCHSNTYVVCVCA